MCINDSDHPIIIYNLKHEILRPWKSSNWPERVKLGVTLKKWGVSWKSTAKRCGTYILLLDQLKQFLFYNLVQKI